MRLPEKFELQNLEARQLMAAVPLASTVGAYGNGQQLRITGTAAADSITLTQTELAFV